LARLKVSNVNFIETDALEFESEELFDKVLLDAPCSGLGTLTKKPDLKWKRELMDIKKLSELQYKLLTKGAALLKPGGIWFIALALLNPKKTMTL